VRISSESAGGMIPVGSLAISRKRTRPRWSADLAAASLAPLMDATSSSEMSKHVLQDHRGPLQGRKPHERAQAHRSGLVVPMEGIRSGKPL
jgi:hypothetical protein